MFALSVLLIAVLTILIVLGLMSEVSPTTQERTMEKRMIEAEGTRNYTKESKELKYLHLRSTEDPNIAVTIAYLFDRKNKQVHYQVARCSHGDSFCKRIGRTIASGRYAKYGPGWVLDNINSNEDLYDQLTMLWHPDGDAVFALEERV